MIVYEIIRVNRDKNSVYVCKYSSEELRGDSCSNDSLKLDDFENNFNLKLNDGEYLGLDKSFFIMKRNNKEIKENG